MQLYLRAFMVALIVGTILLIINQHSALLGETPLRVMPAILTYCVPFCVFIFGKKYGS